MEQAFAKQNPGADDCASRLKHFAMASVVLTLFFAVPLYDLIRFSAGSELYSYILLIPFISAYLIWLKKQNLPPVSQPVRGIAVGFLMTGAAVLIAYWLVLRPRLKLLEDDYLAMMMIS